MKEKNAVLALQSAKIKMKGENPGALALWYLRTFKS